MKNKIYKKIKKWKARLGEDIFCIVEPNPFLAQMMMFLYGIVGVMLVCDIVLCVSDYHKAGMQEIIKDLPVLVMTLAPRWRQARTKLEQKREHWAGAGSLRGMRSCQKKNFLRE